MLTDLKIKGLKPKTKLYRVADREGLCIEVTPSGSKLWRWRYYYLGKPQMLALGKYPAVSYVEAKKRRDEARKQLEDGKHPTREKKIQRLRDQHKNENTFEKISRRWLELKRQGLNQKYWTQSLTRMEQHVFPKIGHLPISEIDIPDVAAVVEEIGARGTIETAKRMKQLISQVFRYASQRGLCKHNPAADLRGLLPMAQEKHHACIHPNELPALMSAIQARDEDLTKFAMRLMALTILRTNELIAAKWEEINWEKKEWHIPKERMKRRRPHMVPLSQQALAILNQLRVWTGEKTYIFFSAASKSKHISNNTVLMGLRRMGYAKIMTGHGFRSLASTILNDLHYPSDVVECALAHLDNDKVRAVYNRADYVAQRKKMMQDYADILDASVQRDDSKILPLKQSIA